MSNKSITFALVAAVLALAAIAPGAASAAEPQIAAKAQYHSNGHNDWRRPHRDWDRRHACSPREAVIKARRMGLRHARVARVGHRAIVVAGRDWGRYGGYRARIVFARNSRHCAVVGRGGY
ncbi:MAG: hypothetical protein KDJ90_15345 [Nitratireductor sp.]|nr:hypothetical protein [Nitratireductor sp.]